MDTSKLKKFAVEARKSLMGTVGAKLKLVLAENSFERRNNPKAIKALEGLIKEIGEEQTIEKVAYTWFNRFIALRFMDVNHYTKIGVVSPVEGQTQPEVLSEVKAGYIDVTIVSDEAKQRILGLLDGAISSPKPQEEVYRLLLVSYCNAWNKQLPFMFGRIKDYTELLMPDDLLSESSVLTQTVETLDADTCKDVEVIGWLYQYYITEINDFVYNSNSKFRISKEFLPAATQIFTPEWAVRYMVENSVGKMWLESHPDKNLQSKFKYYLESAEQEDDVNAKLQEIINPNLKPQDIKVLDPACGSGHILVKAFEVLFEIYKSQGWQENEIPEMILKHNLFGLDICDRAAQLSQLAVMMKAREYDRNIFNKVTELNICSMKDTNWLDFSIADELLNGVSDKDKATKQIRLLQDTFKDAKEYGSILKVSGLDFDFWDERITYFNQKGQASLYGDIIKGRLRFLIKQAKIMQQQYECVVANPPYMGQARMSEKLSDYVTKYYNIAKSDLNMCFLSKSLSSFLKKDGYNAFITPVSWMSIKSFETFRRDIVSNTMFVSLIDLGTEVFEGKNGHLPTVTWVCKNTNLIGNFVAVRLTDYCYSRRDEKLVQFFNKENYFVTNQNNLLLLKSCSLLAYMLPSSIFNCFKNSRTIDDFSDFTGSQNKTANNELYLRYMWEISSLTVGRYNHWAFYAKGGEYRKWYGNISLLVDISNKAISYYKENKTSNLLDNKYWFTEGITYSAITSKGANFRYYPAIGGFDVGGATICYLDNLKYFLGLLNSNIATRLLQVLNPTVNLQVNDIKNLPIKLCDNISRERIDTLVEQNIAISKDDWDSFETSWDFEENPLIRFKTDGKVANSFNAWAKYKDEQFNQLKANEEELNRLFIEIYGLQDEMTPDVADKDITVAKADELRDIKSLISYAVGCMFGRYSLDNKGLVYAGGEFDESKYKTFKADKDNAIPVLSDNYFVDDVVERFYNFIKVAFGEKHFDENISYIVNVLGKKNSQTADQVLRDYFVKDFYKDHVQMYQKRPIYWMFSSEKNGFNALVYLHRYNKDTVNIVLNEYLREYQNKLSAKISSCSFMETKADASQSDKIKAGKERQALQIILNEVEEYERNTLYPLATERKEIDLDDGVKVNYLKFGKALRNISLKEKA